MLLKRILAKKQNRVNKKKENNNLSGLIFISPWLIGFLAFTIIPMIMSLYYSFTNYNILTSPEWVGLKNYMNIIFNDGTFKNSVKTTFFYAFVSVPLRLLFALLLAVLFNQRRKLVGFYRTIFYVPSLIGGSVAISVMWRQLFGST